MGKRVLGALIPFPSLSNACHAGYDYVDVRRALQNKHLTARTLNFSLLQLRVSSFVLLLMACVKNKILVLVLASSCEKESGFQRKEREKENLIFGNLPIGWGGRVEHKHKCTEQDYVNLSCEPEN